MISIGEDRLKHILAVARRCYEIAKYRGFNETFCRKMFVIGFLHDIGYEFSESNSEHSDVGYELLKDIISDEKILLAIKKHGKVVEEQSKELNILNCADMTVDSKGNVVDVLGRLKDIRDRYNEHPEVYLTAIGVAEMSNLIGVNSLRKDTFGG
jgi:predicted hydrolase (HD superfamily)